MTPASSADSLRGLSIDLRADFAANNNSWSKAATAVFRLGQYAAQRRRRLPARLLWRVLDTFFLRLGLGLEIYPSVTCGPGLRLEHGGQGIVVHPRAALGSHARLFHRVTIGVGSGSEVPVIGDRVLIGVGASVLGGIRIENDAVIAAGAVVRSDVGFGQKVGGIPAVLL